LSVYGEQGRQNKIKYLKLMVCLFIGILYVAFSLQVAFAGVWRLDAPAESNWPRSFRMAADDLSTDGTEISDGLASLNISGSAQPSVLGLQNLYRFLEDKVSGPIYIVDLREESHGFFAGAAVSWYENHNWANRGKSNEASLGDENERMASLTGTIEAVPLGIEDKASWNEAVLEGSTGITEEQAAKRAGFQYVRFTATDQCWPEPAVVDAFVEFYRLLPKEPIWLHFHCQAGHGRTTIFMALYDILKNPRVPLETIVLRQRLLGGVDLFAQAEGADWLAVESRRKVAFLYLFHRYVAEEKDNGFAVPWSLWLKYQAVANDLS
jgi:hypothetical protein